MEKFNILDLRNCTVELARTVEHGRVSLITDHGRPVFLAVPFTDNLLPNGVKLSLAVGLFIEGTVGLSGAAGIAGLSSSEMMDTFIERKIPIADYSKDELNDELTQFDS